MRRASALAILALLSIVGATCGCTGRIGQEKSSRGTYSAISAADTMWFAPPVPDLPVHVAYWGERNAPPPDTLEAIGVGSLPARMYRDGSIFLVDGSHPGDPGRLLFRLSDSLIAEIRGAPDFQLDGVFDLDRCGSPEVFIEYCGLYEGSLSGVTFLVFKRKAGGYVLDLTLGAPSEGYAPAAWFLDESPNRRAFFMTRRDGSSGAALFCLEGRQREFQEIPPNLTDYPDFVDLDRDGHAEICVPYFHGSGDGCWSLWRLRQDQYQQWWPDWQEGPHVTHARVADLDGHGRGSLVAVLMPPGPQGPDAPVWNDVRYLTVWRLRAGQWRQVTWTRLPDCEDPQYPEVSNVRRGTGGVRIILDYGDAPTSQYAFQADSLISIQP